MPIEIYTSSNEEDVARQSFDSPTVYLDHWAIRMLSDDINLQSRFVYALKSKEGTLLLSNLSLMEFSAASDLRHCIDAENFFDRLLPNIYFTSFAIDELHERECAEIDNVKRFWPSADLHTLKFFVERIDDISNGNTMSGFLSFSHENKDQFFQLKNVVVNAVRNILKTLSDDASYISKAKNVKPSDARTRTYNILGELLRGFNLDSNSIMTDNDVLDLMHALVPLNCCDFVLLDGAWAERVDKMNRRMEKESINMHVGKCFSQRSNGVDLFLSDLEEFDKTKNLENIARP